MDADRHPGGLLRDRVVEEPGIALGQLIGVLAARDDILARVRIAVARQRRVVELQVGTAFIGELGDFLAVQAREVGEECLAVAIHARLEGLRPEEPVHHVGRRHGDLRHAAFHHAFQEAIVVGDDAMLALEPRLGIGRRRNAEHAGLVAKTERAVAQGKTFHRIDEAGRPAAPAEFAIGDARQPERLLEGDDLADGVVLDGAESGHVELAGLVRPGRFDETRRSYEAADVLGVKWRAIHAPAPPR